MTHERMLDQKQARAWLKEHGMDYSERQVQRMASDKKLPFRKGPDGRRLFVPLSALEKFLVPDA